MKRKRSFFKREDNTPKPSTSRIRAPKRRRLDPGSSLDAPRPYIVASADTSEDPGAEILIFGLAHNTTETELQQIFELEFELQDYSQFRATSLINFSVSIPYSKRMAFLTVPHRAIREVLLGSRRRFYVSGEQRHLALKPPKEGREPDAKHVERLRSTPYIHSSVKLKIEELHNLLKTPIPVLHVSFGVWLSDTRFSREHTVHSPPGPRSTTGDITMWYDNYRRSVLIRRLGCPAEVGPEIPRSTIVIGVRNINRIYASIKSLSCVLKLRTAVTFEQDGTSAPNAQIRTPSFDQDHSRISPFVSTHLLLQFPSLEVYTTAMEHIHKIPHICSIKDCDVHAEPGEAYARRWMHTLDVWYQELPLQVALYCEQAIRTGAILPETMLHCRDPINRAVQISGVSEAALTVQNLIALVKSPGSFAKSKRTTGQRPSPSEILELLKEAGKLALLELRYDRRYKSRDIALAMQIFVTPTAILFEPPQRDRTNRVLRKYPQHQHHFLRVSFSEEGGSGYRLKPLRGSPVEWSDLVSDLVGGTLVSGPILGGRKFEWLGYSTSALKEHQMLFMTPFSLDDGSTVNAARIRQEMGAFEFKLTRQPAKFGARLGQAFTATHSSIEIPVEAIELIDDIERNAYCFTDGAGEISPELATEIWSSMKRRQGKKSRKVPPSAFQARFGGCKGVWMVNSQLSGIKIRSRKSQQKYASEERGFDICSTSERPIVTYLNRPMIKLLEDLGVPYENFLKLQQRAVNRVERAGESFPEASKLLKLSGLGAAFRAPSFLNNLSEMLGIGFHSSPHGHIDFWRGITMLSIAHSLREIKYRARIPVEGPTLIGVCDTFGILKEGEIFVKVYEEGTMKAALKGKVAITRSPVIHPGDIQFATAIGEVSESSPLGKLINVVVFSAQGDRPLASMLGGGDLDGDLFNVITDESIYPQFTVDPGSYTPVDPHVLDRESTMEDLAEFVVDFVQSDSVGHIATRHLEIADQSDQGSFDPDCIRLAELASHAVDFPKSGVPVDRNSLPRARSRLRPDFLSTAEDVADLDTYPSMKSLGKLYRAVPIQKYARPDETQRGRVDASVLFKSLQEASVRFPKYHLLPPSSESLRKRWKETAATFCDQAEKIALRNCPSRDDFFKLTEEELFLGTIGVSAKIEHSDLNLIHRSRLEISEVVRCLRREIKDLKPDDEEEESDEEVDGPGSDDEAGFAPRGVRRQLAMLNMLRPQPVPNRDDDDGNDSDDSDIMEIPRSTFYGSSSKKEEDHSDSEKIKSGDSHQKLDPKSVIVISDSEDNDDDGAASDIDSVVEVAPPDPKEVVIKRAFNACHYALEVLSDQEEVPYGTRLFAYVALQIMLVTIRRDIQSKKALHRGSDAAD